MMLDLDDFRRRIGQEFDNEATLTGPEMLDLCAELAAARAKLSDAYAALVGYSEGEPGEVLRRLIAQHAIDAAEIARGDVERAKSRAEIERLRNGFLCPDCGLGVAADEDGCCVTCGLDCFGFENGKATHLYNYVGDCERLAVKSNKLTARLAADA